MIGFYVEQHKDFELYDAIDEVLLQASVVCSKKEHCNYVKIGAGFDIETTNLKTKSEDYPNVAICYHWQFGLHYYAFMGRTLDSMMHFLKILKECLDSVLPNAKLLVFDANLSFEWQFCKHYWAKMGITKVFAKEERDPLLIEVAGKFVFREVLGLFGMNLAMIAKDYTDVRKLEDDLDYDVIRFESTQLTETEIGYCIRDVEILVKLAEHHVFQNYFGNMGKLPYTQTGIVREAIKKAIGKKLNEVREMISSWMPDKETYDIFRTFLFKGGISGGNILLIGREIKNVRGADITSDYPYQIMTRPFPFGAATKTSIGNFLTKNIPYIVHIKFFKFGTKSSHSLLSVHKALNASDIKKDKSHYHTILDNNRIQYCDEVELYINDVEYKTLQKAYSWKHEVILECWEFKEGYRMLPKWITSVCADWFKKKQKLKEEGKDGTLEYLQAKQFVNSIFGMMCTALFDVEIVYDDIIEDLKVNEDETGMKITKEYKEVCKYLYLSPYWGFWITSYARDMLVSVITKFPQIIVQYDTDSVYYIDDDSFDSNRLTNYLKEFNRANTMANQIMFDEDRYLKDLGNWTFTEKFQSFKSLGSKRYMYLTQDGEYKVVIAGCRKYKGESTLIIQNRISNGFESNPFDFFEDGMIIEEENSNKLCSHYIDVPVSITYKGKQYVIPSCVALTPIKFSMKMGEFHKIYAEQVQDLMKNTTDRRIYNLWRMLTKESNTSTMTRHLELSTIGD